MLKPHTLPARRPGSDYSCFNTRCMRQFGTIPSYMRLSARPTAYQPRFANPEIFKALLELCYRPLIDLTSSRLRTWILLLHMLNNWGTFSPVYSCILKDMVMFFARLSMLKY